MYLPSTNPVVGGDVSDGTRLATGSSAASPPPSL